jgi:hypothetical protein
MRIELNVEQSKTQKLPATMDGGVEQTAIRIAPAAVTKPLATRIWNELLDSRQERNRLATELSSVVGPCWYIHWNDDHLIAARQLVRPPGAAFGTPAPRGPSLGSPQATCDGQSIVIDKEPTDQSVLDDLAYLTTKIAKFLGSTKVSIDASPHFQQRFSHYALRDTDFYSWTAEMARTLRQRQAENVDWEGIAEELEDLGRSEEAALKSHLQVLLSHLLKWAYQPDPRGKSWKRSIGNSRDEVTELLDTNPGLRRKLDSIFARAYRKARRDAAADTALEEDSFPTTSPWDFGEAITEDFWPGRNQESQ